MPEKSEGAAGEPTEVDRLVSLMLKKIYYVMHRRITVPERAGSVLLDHLRRLIDLEKQVLSLPPVRYSYAAARPRAE